MKLACDETPFLILIFFLSNLNDPLRSDSGAYCFAFQTLENSRSTAGVDAESIATSVLLEIGFDRLLLPGFFDATMATD